MLNNENPETHQASQDELIAITQSEKRKSYDVNSLIIYNHRTFPKTIKMINQHNKGNTVKMRTIVLMQGNRY